MILTKRRIGWGLAACAPFAFAFACSASATNTVTDAGHTGTGDGGTLDDGGTIDDDAGGGFDAGPIDDPSCVKTPPGNTCGLDPNCGCGTGTCDLDHASDAGNVKCVAAGTGILGHLCAATSDCLSGLTCQFGACRPFCNATDAGAKCPVVGTNVCYDGKAGANDKVCGIQCDLRDRHACGAPDGGTEGCAYRESTGGTDCYPVGTSTTSCVAVTDCAPGYWCIEGGICQRWCRIGQDAIDCSDNGTKNRCIALTPPIDIGADQYGTCGQ